MLTTRSHVLDRYKDQVLGWPLENAFVQLAHKSNLLAYHEQKK